MKTKISVIGLGYVGLPLAVEFAKRYNVVGFDIKKSRIDQLMNGKDITREIGSSVLNITEINKDKELNKMIYSETTKQLDRFSNIFYNKIKLNSEISEF